jgi:hypothetical protein
MLTVCPKPIQALNDAFGGQLTSVAISGSAVPVIRASMPRWRRHAPSSEFQHWNKGYWIDDGGEPGFAETAIAHALEDDTRSARWASSSFGALRFRIDARRRSPDELAVQAPPPAVMSILQELAEEVIVRAQRANLVDVRGGCWDVVAWRRRSPLLFVEAKQQGESWSDALRPSQRLWLEAAREASHRCCFAVVDWKMRS